MDLGGCDHIYIYNGKLQGSISELTPLFQKTRVLSSLFQTASRDCPERSSEPWAVLLGEMICLYSATGG